MNFKKLILAKVLIFNSIMSFSQENASIVLPNSLDWNKFEEGFEKSLNFNVDITSNFLFTISQGKQLGMSLDSLGNFRWKPPYELVNRVEKERIFQLIIQAKSDTLGTINRTIDLRLFHSNRPPVVNELKPFYVKFNSLNTYQISKDFVFDDDGDPIAIIPSIEELPEGMEINSAGNVSWNPSFTQFKNLKEKPIYITFYAEDQPSKSKVEGKLKLIATQLDLSPEITSIPKFENFKVRENETVNIRFYLSDPNGDDDIQTFDYVANTDLLPKNLLTKNTQNQYEFTWLPGYKFVNDPQDSVSFTIDFFVLDKTQKREVKQVNFSVVNTLNQEEEDLKQYNLYRGTLLRAWELMEQLKEKEKELKIAYNRAKKGKKQRSVVNAGLGATTSLSSIVINNKEKNDLQRTISTIGGTTVLTIGTLEATEVIGRSTKDLIDRLNYIIEKKNDVQTKGDIFARDFSLKSTRRTNDFTRNMDDFMKAMQLKGLVALELDASWEPKVKSTDKAIKQTFKDFVID